MASVKRAAAAVAAILVREGVDYAQSKAVFKAARERAGLRAAPEHRGGVERLTVEEELRFLDQAYAQDGRTGLMLQTLLETGARASELVQLRVEDVSLVERVITIRQGKGRKRREVPIRRDLAQLLRLHIGARRAGPLFASRQEGSGPTPHVLTRSGSAKSSAPSPLLPGSASASTHICCATRWQPACSRLAWTSPICNASSDTRASPPPVFMRKRQPPRCSAGSIS
jgi:integrase/recombinase XerD